MLWVERGSVVEWARTHSDTVRILVVWGIVPVGLADVFGGRGEQVCRVRSSQSPRQVQTGELENGRIELELDLQAPEFQVREVIPADDDGNADLVRRQALVAQSVRDLRAQGRRGDLLGADRHTDDVDPRGRKVHLQTGIEIGGALVIRAGQEDQIAGGQARLGVGR